MPDSNPKKEHFSHKSHSHTTNKPSDHPSNNKSTATNDGDLSKNSHNHNRRRLHHSQIPEKNPHKILTSRTPSIPKKIPLKILKLNPSAIPKLNHQTKKTSKAPLIPVSDIEYNIMDDSNKLKYIFVDGSQQNDYNKPVDIPQQGFLPLSDRTAKQNFILFDQQPTLNNHMQLLPNLPISKPNTTKEEKSLNSNSASTLKKYSVDMNIEPATFKINNQEEGVFLHPTRSFSKFLKKNAKKEKKKNERSNSIISNKNQLKDANILNHKLRSSTILKKDCIDSTYSQSSNNENLEKLVEKKLLSSDWAGAIKKFKTYNPTKRREYWQHFFTSNKIFSVIEKADFYVKSAIIGFLLGQKFHAALLLKESLKDESHERTFLMVTILKNLMKKVPFKTYLSMYSIDIKYDIPSIPAQMRTISNILTATRESKFTKSEKNITEKKLKIFNLIEFSKEDELFKMLLTLSRKFLIKISKEYYLAFGLTISDHVVENNNFSEYMKKYVNHSIPIFFNEKNYIVQFLGYCVTQTGDPFIFWHIIMYILEEGKFDIISEYEIFFKESIVAKLKYKLPSFFSKLILTYIKLYIPDYNENNVKDK